MFQNLLGDVDRQVTLFTVKAKVQTPEDAVVENKAPTDVQAGHPSFDEQQGAKTGENDTDRKVVTDENGNPIDLSPEGLAKMGIRVGRNEPCPCGSGKRYKQCHGALK